VGPTDGWDGAAAPLPRLTRRGDQLYALPRSSRPGEYTVPVTATSEGEMIADGHRVPDSRRQTPTSEYVRAALAVGSGGGPLGGGIPPWTSICCFLHRTDPSSERFEIDRTVILLTL